MMTEIIELYINQYNYYKDIEKILVSIRNDKSSISEHQIELENVDFILEKIKKLNEKIEQLKQIYVTKHNISDFTGEALRISEDADSYNKLKEAIDNLTEEIANVKNIHDLIIKKMLDEEDTTRKIILNKKPDIKGLNMYKKNVDK